MEFELESILCFEVLSMDEIWWFIGEESFIILVDELGWYSVNIMGDICFVLMESVEIILVEIEEVEEEEEEEIYFGDLWLLIVFILNGDGINDVFCIWGLVFDVLVVFWVYDCWGQELFYSFFVVMGWDGYYCNCWVLFDIYFYILCYFG